jgi:hypothetical protein
MTAAAEPQPRTRRTAASAVALAWWSRPDRSTIGLAALFGGLPLGAYVGDPVDASPAPRAAVVVAAAQP